MGTFYSGTSNLMMPVKNKSYFPPEFRDSTRLTFYASLFNSIEINASFYKMPLNRTILKWASEVPDDFKFTFKLIKTATHCDKGLIDTTDIPEFLSRIETPKKGCLLVQLPPSFSIDLFQLNKLIAALEISGWRIAIEFRNKSWYTGKVFKTLHDHNFGLVIHDMGKSVAPLELTSDKFVYLRFHGPEPGYRGSYDDAMLHEYAGYILDWTAAGKDVYAYFNNSLGAAVQDLLRLNDLVATLK